jgi:hypothetical protein
MLESLFALSFLLLSFYVYSACHVKQCFVLYCLLIILNKEIKYIYILLGKQYRAILDKFRTAIHVFILKVKKNREFCSVIVL